MSAMMRSRLQAIFAALALACGCAQAALETGPAPQVAASEQVQFPELPLRRDAAAGESAAGSLAWAVLFLAVVAGVGFVLVRKRGIAGLRPGTSGASVPVSLGRTNLTQQASVHVIEWRGEELLLGCTPHSVVLLARAPGAKAGT